MVNPLGCWHIKIFDVLRVVLYSLIPILLLREVLHELLLCLYLLLLDLLMQLRLKVDFLVTCRDRKWWPAREPRWQISICTLVLGLIVEIEIRVQLKSTSLAFQLVSPSLHHVIILLRVFAHHLISLTVTHRLVLTR